MGRVWGHTLAAGSEDGGALCVHLLWPQAGHITCLRPSFLSPKTRMSYDNINLSITYLQEGVVGKGLVC